MPLVPAKNSGWKAVVFIIFLVALACEVGLRLYWHGEQSVSMIWPAAGVAVAVFHRWGGHAFPWVVLGYTWIWVRLGFTSTSSVMPILVPLEALGVWSLGFRLPLVREATRNSINPTVWQLLPVPWLAALPCALAIAGLGTIEGRFDAGEFGMATARIAISHVHGMVAFAPAFVHVLRRDFQLLSPDDHWLGFAALIAAFALMVMAFSGFFHDVVGMSFASYLPFPLLMVAGVSLRPPVIAVTLMLWCIATTLITNLGMGPFTTATHLNPLELGIYNLVICYTTYLISVGTTHLIWQLRRNELTMEAAGVEVWEWDARRGFHSVKGDREAFRINHRYAGAPETAHEGLSRLSGKTAGTNGGIPDHWKERLEPRDGTAELLLSAGRVTSRQRDGTAQEAIGILQDLSMLRKAEEALIALGHQRALLKSLQVRLNPHFLFNALNAVRALIHIDARQASDAVTTLARLLRKNLKNVERPQIPLADEMQLVRDLFAISGWRFGDRLSTQITIPRKAENALVPPMAVFNLVENALVHGIEKSSGSGLVTVAAEVSGGKLTVRISNPGQLAAPLSPGVGMQDVLQRLELLYGANAYFSLTQAGDNLIEARMTLPFQDNESIDR
ncbi:histidine kinase [Luteolibacter sp. Populi]|uniref:histidine kinase n=1 Tax=Luteolibacter sp. Populi TaxID=3230487 RepID=UPI00346622DA